MLVESAKACYKLDSESDNVTVKRLTELSNL